MCIYWTVNKNMLSNAVRMLR